MDYSIHDGSWVCLKCRTAFALQLEDRPTLGQREQMLCPRCGTNTVHEYSEQPPTRRETIALPTGFVPTLEQRDRLAAQGGATFVTYPPPQPAAQAIFPEPLGLVPVPGVAVAAPGVALPTAEQVAQQSTEQLQQLRTQLAAALQAIEAELHERAMCVICFAQPREVIFYPCKHRAACRGCSPKLVNCPMCRGLIQDRIVPFD